MIKTLKTLCFCYFNFSGKLGKDKFRIYFVIDILLNIIAIVLYANVNLDNRNILNLFYVCILILLKFIPMQASTTRRLRDINLNPVFVFVNIIPVLSILFRIYLCFAKQKEDLTLRVCEIGRD